jgi:hypothetical protein
MIGLPISGKTDGTDVAVPASDIVVAEGVAPTGWVNSAAGCRSWRSHASDDPNTTMPTISRTMPGQQRERITAASGDAAVLDGGCDVSGLIAACAGSTDRSR